MEFKDLTREEQRDYSELMAILSANSLDKSGYNAKRPMRTEEEILDSCSRRVRDMYGEYLQSIIKR